MAIKTEETVLKDTMYVKACPNKWAKEGELPFTYRLSAISLCHGDETLVYSDKISITIPAGIDLVNKAVESFEAQQEALRAKAYVEIQEIQEKIDNLKLLEHTPDLSVVS